MPAAGAWGGRWCGTAWTGRPEPDRGIQFNAVVATNVYAVALYEDLGFSVTGRIPGGFRHPEHGFVDLLIMYCDLIGYRDL